MARLHAIVAGAGIGGLTAAIALARADCDVTVLERARTIEPLGAGIQISPNAAAVLRGLHLLNAVRFEALQPEAIRIRAAGGRDLARIPLGAVAETRWGAPSLVMHRGDLQRVLLAQVACEPGIALRTACDVKGFADVEGGIVVGLKHDGAGQEIAGDFLIGADGLRSTIRDQLGFGARDAPIYSGRTAWRGLIEGVQAPPHALDLETNLWLGAGAHLVHYPLRGGALVNVVAIVSDEWRGGAPDAFWSTPGEAAFVTARYRRWAPAARALVGAVRDWRKWPLFDRNATARWSLGRVALLGDAAHAMLPFLAQGSAQAIEDAAALGAAVRRHGADVRAAFEDYEHARAPRAAAVQAISRRQGSIYHLPQPAALARDVVLGALGPTRLLARYDWLYAPPAA